MRFYHFPKFILILSSHNKGIIFKDSFNYRDNNKLSLIYILCDGKEFYVQEI